MEFKDYYETLNIKRDASEAEIKSAYRKLARKFHPDVNKTKDAEKKFKELNEAYEVLSDKNKRSRYDSLGANWQGGQSYTPPPGFEGFNFGGGQGGQQSYNFGGQDFGGFSDFFSSMFGDMMGGGQQSTRRSAFDGFDFGGAQQTRQQAKPKTKKADLDLTKTLNVTAKDIFEKKPITVKFNNVERCNQCSSSGGFCASCGGTGITTEQKNIKVKLPTELKEGQKIRVKGEGKSDAYGQQGDLYLIINFKDGEYQINGADLTKEIEITPPEAVLGTKKEISTLHGNITINIPPKTSTGQALRLKNLGLSKKEGGFGNLNAKIKIVLEKDLSDEKIKLYKKLLEL